MNYIFFSRNLETKSASDQIANVRIEGILLLHKAVRKSSPNSVPLVKRWPSLLWTQKKSEFSLKWKVWMTAHRQEDSSFILWPENLHPEDFSETPIRDAFIKHEIQAMSNLNCRDGHGCSHTFLQKQTNKRYVPWTIHIENMLQNK